MKIKQTLIGVSEFKKTPHQSIKKSTVVTKH
jgi:hypothetical protein